MSRLGLLAGKRDPWSPYLLPRSVLKAWWCADDHGSSVLMTDDGAGLISSWKDRIGGYTMTAATTERPTWAANWMGFSGANCMTLTTLPSALPSGSTALELWATVDQTATVAGDGTGVRATFGWGASNTGTNNMYIGRTGTGNHNRLTFQRGNGASTAATEATVDFSGRHVIRGIADGSTLVAEIDGVQSTGVASGTATTATTRLRAGALFSASASFFQIGSSRDLMVTSLLAAADAVKLRAWLAARL